jgi:hypothetical protein
LRKYPNERKEGQGKIAMSSRISMTQRCVAWQVANQAIPKLKGNPMAADHAERRKKIRRKAKRLLQRAFN